MHHTGKKESKKEKQKKIRSRKICFKEIRTGTLQTREDWNPLDHLDKHWQYMFERSIYSFSMVIDSFQGWLFRFPCRIKSLTNQSQT